MYTSLLILSYSPCRLPLKSTLPENLPYQAKFEPYATISAFRNIYSSNATECNRMQSNLFLSLFLCHQLCNRNFLLQQRFVVFYLNVVGRRFSMQSMQENIYLMIEKRNSWFAAASCIKTSRGFLRRIC